MACADTASMAQNQAHYQQLAEKAWHLWNQANKIADDLWNEFESYFIDKCIEETTQVHDA